MEECSSIGAIDRRLLDWQSLLPPQLCALQIAYRSEVEVVLKVVVVAVLTRVVAQLPTGRVAHCVVTAPVGQLVVALVDVVPA